LSCMAGPGGCTTTVDGVYLTRERCSLCKISDGYNQSGEGSDHSLRSGVRGLVPFEPYPLGLENFPAPGGSMVRGDVQVPLYTLPLPPRLEFVPQVKYGVKVNSKRGFNPQSPITFSVGGQGGMLLQDAMGEKYEGLVGRDDPMFPGCRRTAISLRIQWPGCEPWTRHVNTVNWKNPRGPITRSTLAHKISKIMDSFIKDDKGKAKVGEHWRVGAGHIELKDLILDSIEHVSRGSWQPRFFVMRRE